MQKRIIITGGPGTGKSSIIKDLEERGYKCIHEVSREITLAAQKEGINQLFLEKPILFSERILEARILQFEQASTLEKDMIFIDRGIPDVLAYMDYFKTNYPSIFDRACNDYRYDIVYLLPPWEDIYLADNERYESFSQSLEIHHHLQNTYLSYGYAPIEVPIGTVASRSEFILNHLGN
ncbi:ATP-binding protein [soil metagenome]